MNTANQSVMLAAWRFVGLVVCLEAGYRRAFREYLDTRLQVYEQLNLSSREAAEEE